MSIRNKMIAALLTVCMSASAFSGVGTVFAEENGTNIESQAEEESLSEAQADTSGDVVDELEAKEEKQKDLSGDDEDKNATMGVSLEQFEEEDDPGRGRLAGDVPAEFYGDEKSFSTLATSITHDSRFDSYKKIKGIDVSKWNGNIDWKKVKAAGIDFAIVRIGARGTSSGKMIYDEYAVKNLENAVAAGVKVGAYVFSQAITEKEAIEEADYMTSRLKGYDITMPVVFDFEYYSGGRLDKKNLSKSAQTKICLAACNRIKAAGYTPMLYANLSMLKKDLDASQISAKYLIWLARYNSYAGYDGDYEYWQYTSSGKVNGISGKVDMNYWYTKTGIATENISTGSTDDGKPAAPSVTGKATAFDKVKLTWNKVSGAKGYVVYRYNSSSKKYEKLTTIKSGSTLTYTNGSRNAQTTYKYQVKAYKTVNSKTVYSAASATVSVKTSAPVDGTVNATDVNVRKGASTSKAVVTMLTLNKIVSLTGSSGDWYKISFKEGSEQKTGYILKTYITSLKAPSLSGSATSSTKVKLTWKKVSGASGYQIRRYNTVSKKWESVKSISKAGTLTYTDTKRSKNTTYKYKMRAYKTVNGRKVYSSYSSTKSVKTKK